LNRHENISINLNVNFDCTLFVDNQIIVAKSEDNLQYSVYSLNDTAAEFPMEIGTGEKGGELKLGPIGEWNHLKAIYALVIGYWNQLILFNLFEL
jgi:hypothetical protein